MPRALEIAGERFGKLVAIDRAANSGSNTARWNCKCDCGETCVVSVRNLTTDHTKSCGCLQWKGGQYNRGSLAWCNRVLTNRTRSSQERGYLPPRGTENDVLALWKSSGGYCEVTQLPFDDEFNRPALDHCHLTGELRRFIGLKANTAIGLLDDSFELADGAAKYLAYFEMGDFIRKRCIA